MSCIARCWWISSGSDVAIEINALTLIRLSATSFVHVVSLARMFLSYIMVSCVSLRLLIVRSKICSKR